MPVYSQNYEEPALCLFVPLNLVQDITYSYPMCIIVIKTKAFAKTQTVLDCNKVSATK